VAVEFAGRSKYQFPFEGHDNDETGPITRGTDRQRGGGGRCRVYTVEFATAMRRTLSR